MSAARGTAIVMVMTVCGGCILLTDTSGFSSGGGDGSVAPLSGDASVGGDDATTDAGGPSFRDDFARADGPDIGNGWIEKAPNAFSLAGGVVAKVQTGTTYFDNLVFRPAEEDRLDVEVSAVVGFGAVLAYPQVFARAQRTTIATPRGYDGYMLFVSAQNQVSIARQRSTADEMQLATIVSPQPFSAASSIRMTLRVSGTNPVVLEAVLEQLEGGAWTKVGETRATDTTDQRIDAPGAVGFSAAFPALPRLDDFRWRGL